MIALRSPRVFVTVLLAGAALAACSASTTHNGFTGSGGEGASGMATGGASTSGTGAGDSTGVGIFDAGFGGQGQGGAAPGCAAETQFVYTLTSDNELYRFNPPTLEFTLVGTLDCPTVFASPYSMAVDRDGQAWSIFTDGNLFRFDTKNAHCTATSFVPGQQGFFTFGMGFSANAPGSTAETLFVSDSAAGSGSTQGLATIDTQTMVLTPVSGYDKVSARAEMTGTGDARLYGAFEGSPYVVAEIEKSSAHILSQAPQSAINYAPGSSNFAFAFWGGDFWLFVGPGTSTDVFRYRPSDNTTTKMTTVPQIIVGAGVSTCAPLKPPT
ncbi:hypothetical protein A7982_13360 [Minicystis rosea]|nr:hypothetical protein A7982_13360 [Minicystis rosea]